MTRPATKLLLSFVVLILTGCETKDFKVVDALRVGMTQEEARATIASFGFHREQALERPVSGWVLDSTARDLPSRAHKVEEKSGKEIATAEYYPVHHGLLGFGELFLFYDGGGRLVDYYRHQIN